ncbi:Bromodomain [Cinara cedri]|uniref:Bromodomain n=1 Tax=Cinara cedri TaxID=506608 RepID=A0A5E4NKW3_9HEMI|nr:Bromodomain [Cinara cedri]
MKESELKEQKDLEFREAEMIRKSQVVKIKAKEKDMGKEIKETQDKLPKENAFWDFDNKTKQLGQVSFEKETNNVNKMEIDKQKRKKQKSNNARKATTNKYDKQVNLVSKSKKICKDIEDCSKSPSKSIKKNSIQHKVGFNYRTRFSSLIKIGKKEKNKSKFPRKSKFTEIGSTLKSTKKKLDLKIAKNEEKLQNKIHVGEKQADGRRLKKQRQKPRTDIENEILQQFKNISQDTVLSKTVLEIILNKLSDKYLKRIEMPGKNLFEESSPLDKNPVTLTDIRNQINTGQIKTFEELHLKVLLMTQKAGVINSINSKEEKIITDFKEPKYDCFDYSLKVETADAANKEDKKNLMNTVDISMLNIHFVNKSISTIYVQGLRAFG